MEKRKEEGKGGGEKKREEERRGEEGREKKGERREERRGEERRGEERRTGGKERRTESEDRTGESRRRTKVRANRKQFTSRIAMYVLVVNQIQGPDNSTLPKIHCNTEKVHLLVLVFIIP